MGYISFFPPQQSPRSRFLNDALIYSKLLEMSYGEKNTRILVHIISSELKKKSTPISDSQITTNLRHITAYLTKNKKEALIDKVLGSLTNYQRAKFIGNQTKKQTCKANLFNWYKSNLQACIKHFNSSNAV